MVSSACDSKTACESLMVEHHISQLHLVEQCNLHSAFHQGILNSILFGDISDGWLVLSRAPLTPLRFESIGYCLGGWGLLMKRALIKLLGAPFMGVGERNFFLLFLVDRDIPQSQV